MHGVGVGIGEEDTGIFVLYVDESVEVSFLQRKKRVHRICGFWAYDISYISIKSQLVE